MEIASLNEKHDISRIFRCQVRQPLLQGAHQDLGLFVFRRRDLRQPEGEDPVIVFVDNRFDAADALQRVHAGASEDGNRGADDVASGFPPAAVSFNPAAGESVFPLIQRCGDHYALIAVISTLV